MKYKSINGKDIILDGEIYRPGKNGIVDLPKKYNHPDLTELSADEVKALNKDSDNKSLSDMTVKELKEIAEKKEIEGFDKMKKDELIKAIEK